MHKATHYYETFLLVTDLLAEKECIPLVRSCTHAYIKIGENVARKLAGKPLVAEISENDCNDSKFHSQ